MGEKLTTTIFGSLASLTSWAAGLIPTPRIEHIPQFVLTITFEDMIMAVVIGFLGGLGGYFSRVACAYLRRNLRKNKVK